MGRPTKEIDQTEFEKLCFLQCTRDEICGWFDIAEKTLYSWVKRTYHEDFSTVFDKKRSGGKISLRRAQFHLAEKNAAMAIWLGKQYLGQREQIDIGTDDNDIVLKFIEGMKSAKPKRQAERIPSESGSQMEH